MNNGSTIENLSLQGPGRKTPIGIMTIMKLLRCVFFVVLFGLPLYFLAGLAGAGVAGGAFVAGGTFGVAGALAGFPGAADDGGA